MDEMLVFKAKGGRENSKVMRVSENFETLINMIKVKTNLPTYEITKMMAVYLADKVVIDEADVYPLFRKE